MRALLQPKGYGLGGGKGLAHGRSRGPCSEVRVGGHACGTVINLGMSDSEAREGRQVALTRGGNRFSLLPVNMVHEAALLALRGCKSMQGTCWHRRRAYFSSLYQKPYCALPLGTCSRSHVCGSRGMLFGGALLLRNLPGVALTCRTPDQSKPGQNLPGPHVACA
jgi:hypothetical protein